MLARSQIIVSGGIYVWLCGNSLSVNKRNRLLSQRRKQLTVYESQSNKSPWLERKTKREKKKPKMATEQKKKNKKKQS